MKFWFTFFAYCITFIVLAWGFNLINVEAHEQAHVAIFSNYNISSNYTMDWFTGEGYTFPNHDQYVLYCGDSCKTAQSLNEIIGYNVNTFTLAMICTAFILGLILIMIINFAEIKDVVYKDIINQLLDEKEKEGGEEPFAELSDSTG